MNTFEMTTLDDRALTAVTGGFTAPLNLGPEILPPDPLGELGPSFGGPGPALLPLDNSGLRF